MLQGCEPDAGKYPLYPATVKKTEEYSEWKRKKKQRAQCLAFFPNKWDAKINSQPECLASEEEEEEQLKRI